MIRNLARVECDLCGKRGPEAPDCLSVRQVARKVARWRILTLNVYGNEMHFCPACARGKTDEWLYQAAIAAAEKEGDAQDQGKT